MKERESSIEMFETFLRQSCICARNLIFITVKNYQTNSNFIEKVNRKKWKMTQNHFVIGKYTKSKFNLLFEVFLPEKSSQKCKCCKLVSWTFELIQSAKLKIKVSEKG